MNKQISLVIAGFFMTILLLGTISALDWSGADNYKKFNEEGKYGRIEIWDTATLILFQTDDRKLVEYELLDNTDQCLINCHAEGTANLYERGKLFSDLNFKDSKGISTNLKESKILIWTIEEYEVEVDDYKEVCGTIIDTNGTSYQSCSNNLIGTHKEIKTKEYWKEYNFESLDAGNYRWRIEAKKKPHESIDWIGTSFGKELTEWAFWSTDWGKKSLITITGNNGEIVYMNISYLNVSSAQTDFDDIRFVNSAEDTEFGYFLQKKIDSNSAQFRVNTSGDTSFYIYSDNAGASSTSDIEDIYGTNLVSFYALDGTTGNVIDLVGINNGTNHGADRGVTGKIYNAFDLELSESDYVRLDDGTGTLADITDTLSVILWHKPETVPTGHLLSGGVNSWGFYLTVADKLAFGKLGVGQAGATTGTIVAGEWQHMAVTYDGTADSVSLYLNGSLDAGSPDAYSATFTADLPRDLGRSPANSEYTDGIFDDVGIWNRALSAEEVLAFYNTTEPTFTLGAEESVFKVVTKQSYPINNYNSSNRETNLGCNFTGLGGENITDVTVLVYDSSGNLDYTNTESGLVLTSYNKTWTTSVLTEDTYLWACYGEGTVTEDYDGNRTFNVDLTFPLINITSPPDAVDYHHSNRNLTLNWSVSDLHLESCWYNHNNTNITLTCSVNTTQFIVTEYSNRNLTFYANDTFGNENSTIHEWTYQVWENSRTFENLTYETATETYSINVTANSTLTATNLIYGGTSYASTLSGDTYSTTLTHTNNGTNEFYWNFTYGGDIISSYTSNQTVNRTEFNLCNTSDVYLNTTFLNITFLDEETLVRLGAQIDTSTFTYWLGDGSVTEELIYSNLTNMSEYNFCFTPASRTMYNTRIIQYSATGYPQRKYDDDTGLTNTITHKTLYLLSSADGIYSTIQVVDENGDIVIGADVTMERQFSGVWTIVGKETTGSAGAVTFWVNPDYDHRFTVEKTGCVTTTGTIRPTQTTYTATIDCLGADDEIYIAPIEGIKYFLLPASGIITTGNQNFSFQVVSSKDNIVNVKFEIVNGSGYVLTSQTSACATAGCTISIMYNVTSVQNIKGKYYVDLGDGYILLEADAHWIEVDIPARDGTFKQFWLNLRGVFDEWHEVGEDVTNTGDFNRIVFIFLFLAIFIAVFNKLTHFDSSNPGAFLIFLTVVVFMGSIAGFPDAKGFFYLDNFGVSYFINNYIVLGYMLLITITHYVGVQLQKQR